jgi:hypothetical protein
LQVVLYSGKVFVPTFFVVQLVGCGAEALFRALISAFFLSIA